MLNRNDFRYILRRFIIFILCTIAMFIIGIWKAHAMTFSINATPVSTQKVFNSNVQGLLGFGNSGYVNNNEYFMSSQTFTCNTDKCGIEFYYSATAYYRVDYGSSNINNGTGSISLDVIANSAQLFSNNFPSCTVLNNTISCIVDNGSTWSGLKMAFTANFDTSIYQSSSHQGVRYTINDIVNIYDISGDVATAIDNNTQAVNDVNNSINDSSSPTSNEISGNSSEWNSNNAESGVINQLVLMPITLLNSFVNGINGSCSPYDVGELWGEHIVFPCIDLSITLGSVWTIIDVILSGMFIFIFGKRCVKIFNDFTNLRSGQIDTLYGGDN